MPRNAASPPRSPAARLRGSLDAMRREPIVKLADRLDGGDIALLGSVQLCMDAIDEAAEGAGE